jgi:hypothetical protein
VARKLKALLIGSTISFALTFLMWVLKLFYFLIWITLPGWLLSWGAVALMHAENWKHLKAIGITLLTVGNAFFYGLVVLLIMQRKTRATNRHSTGG